MITLQPFPGLKILLSTRSDGSVRDANKARAFVKTHTDLPVSYLKLHHDIQTLSAIESEQDGDAMFTTSDRVLAMVVGDCYPVIFFYPKSHAVLMLHAGWRGLVQRIIPFAVNKFHNSNAIDTKNLKVWIGPGIETKHNQSNQLPAQSTFANWQDFIHRDGNSYFIDLKGFIYQELTNLGIPKSNIVAYPEGTYAHPDKWFSHRRSKDQDDEDGRFLVACWSKEK